MNLSHRIRRRLGHVAILAMAFTAVPLAPAASAQTTGITTVTFDYTGSAQSWTVPSDVQGGQVHVEVLGAQGGDCDGASGGTGGSAKGLFSVTAGDLLRVYVGGQGANAGSGSRAGGFNGGGTGYASGGGGGGSDIRLGGTALANRAIAGGGGGGCNYSAVQGGHGGGALGGNGSGGTYGGGGFGGTQTSGGSKGSATSSHGTDGSLGAGGYATDTWYVAGGGGGYYGGGSAYAGGGGGGSGYTGPLITDGSMISGVRTGHGVVTISYQHATTVSIISPSADTVWNASNTQQFIATASDPQGDDFHAVAEIEDLDTGLTRTLTSERMASGSTATFRPLPPLPAGNYRWKAQACDYPSAPWSESCTPFTPWRNLTVLGNMPAQITNMVAPGDAITWSTNDAQSFAAQASDPDGDRFVAKFEVVPSSAAFDSSAETEFYSGLTNNNGIATASPSQKFGVGSYNWRVVALDTGSGRPGPVSATRTFTVAQAPPPAVNQPPATPTLVSPANGHTFLSSDAQQFVVTTTDPEGDAYRADYELTHQSGVTITFSSPSTASGAQATGQAPFKLPSGNYSWRAKARPASGSGFSSAWSPTRTFTVAPAGANASPNAPTLVSPADGHAYASSDTQTFTVRAVDPDGDIYRAQIEVEKRDALNNLVGYWTFDTAPALSDTETSAILNDKLSNGSYRWRARAVDDAGSGQYGGPSDWRAFTVS